MGAPKLYWFDARSCWRFPYRDPRDGKRRFIFCTPDKYRLAEIDLDSDDVLRRKTKVSEGLAKRLQTRFLNSLACWEPEPDDSSVPDLSHAIELYFALYDAQSPGYRKTLRAIFEEFRDTVGDKPIDRVTDEDLKFFERHLAKRVGRTSVRSYMRQLGMLIHFAVKKGWIRQDPRLTYKLPKEELAIPNPFSMDELTRFFEIAREPVPGHPDGWDYVEWIGIGLLYLGLRPIELQHARWENINWDDRFLFIAKSHGNKEPQALQNQPIPLAAWPEFERRRQESGLIWGSYFGGPVTNCVLQRSRESFRKRMTGFQWKRFRKTYATALQRAGNDVVIVSRLLRQSAGGKNSTVAERHYIGKSEVHLRDIVDEAFDVALAFATT